MKVGLLTDSIERGSPGIRRYSMRLAEELLKLDGADITLLHFSAGKDAFYRDKPTRKLFDSHLPIVGKQLSFYPQTRKLGLDLVHDTYHFPPFFFPGRYAKIMTIHDLTPLTMGTHSLKNRLAHRLLVGQMARRANSIVTPSESTRRDVVRLLGVGPNRVIVTREAADETFRPASPEDISSLRERLRLPDSFLLCLGTLEPRKNLPRVIEAFGEVAPSVPDAHLVIAGRKGWGDPGIKATIRRLGIQSRIHITGRIDDSDLPILYSSARALVYPALYEGFGLPPLEAMQCGTPVITSNVSSLPEVAGDAAILVDPKSTDAIAAAMRCVLDNESVRLEMRERGFKQAARFSWRRCAELTMEVYESVTRSKRT